MMTEGMPRRRLRPSRVGPAWVSTHPGKARRARQAWHSRAKYGKAKQSNAKASIAKEGIPNHPKNMQEIGGGKLFELVYG